jgi:hypothetical protein
MSTDFQICLDVLRDAAVDLGMPPPLACVMCDPKSPEERLQRTRVRSMTATVQWLRAAYTEERLGSMVRRAEERYEKWDDLAKGEDLEPAERHMYETRRDVAWWEAHALENAVHLGCFDPWAITWGACGVWPASRPLRRHAHEVAGLCPAPERYGRGQSWATSSDDDEESFVDVDSDDAAE